MASKRQFLPLRFTIGLRRLAQALAVAAILSVAPLCNKAAFAAPQSVAASHPLSGHIAEASQRFGIPQNWIWAVMRQESGGNPRALSRVGAQGLMQIMPPTWAMLTARYGLGNDAFEPRANIMAGAAYLRLMWDRYRDPRLMLAAYNAGPGRIDSYVARRRGLPAETVNYVSRIAPSLGSSGIASPAELPLHDAVSWRSSELFIDPQARRATFTDTAPSDVSPSRNPTSATLFANISPSQR